MNEKLNFIAVDPGRDKCGLVIVKKGNIVWREIYRRTEITSAIKVFINERPISFIAVGDKTGSKYFITELKNELISDEIDIMTVDEHRSTEQARALYWRDHPRRGWRRLLPISLQVPPRPIDDYAAEVLALRVMLEKKAAKG